MGLNCGSRCLQNCQLLYTVLLQHTSPVALQPSPWVRYYACADDTAHPEVRQVLALALGPESGAPEAVSTPSLAWALDPADQITEPAQPDSDDDTQDPPMVQVMGNSQATAAQQQQQQQQQQAGPASQYSQARSPLVGRCNMWNLLWSWSLKVGVHEGGRGEGRVGKPVRRDPAVALLHGCCMFKALPWTDL
jgi:hypothetical protein